MKHADTVGNWKRRGLKAFVSGLRLKRQSKRLVDGWLGDVEFMMSWIETNERQIHEWKLDEGARFVEHITLYGAINNILVANCLLLLNECDIRVAATHMVMSRDDWECRFFARRIFTLLHEIKAKKGYGNEAGRLMNLIEPHCDKESFASYKACKSKLDHFLDKNDVLFKAIRKTCEAHRSIDPKEQIETIESINIKDSWRLIEEAMDSMLALSVTYMRLMRNLNSRLQKLYARPLIPETDTPIITE